MCANLHPNRSAPREGFVPANGATLYYREVGEGQPVVVLHGGPDFDHTYLLPELDLLAGPLRLIYYDQRGRGKSASGVRPEDVTMESEVEDLDALRAYLGLESVAVMGHSWGGLLAMEYAIRHPDHVSHLILMNTAPASRGDYMFFRQELAKKRGPAVVEEMKSRSSEAAYQEGEPDAVAEYYRVHFRAAIRETEHLESVVERLRASFTKESVLKAWAIEDRLMDQTWLSGEYDLLPPLERLDIPTLVIHSEDDFVPLECSTHIAQAVPGARFVLLRDCGHFSYLECPEELRKAVLDFFTGV